MTHLQISRLHASLILEPLTTLLLSVITNVIEFSKLITFGGNIDTSTSAPVSIKTLTNARHLAASVKSVDATYKTMFNDCLHAVWLSIEISSIEHLCPASRVFSGVASTAV